MLAINQEKVMNDDCTPPLKFMGKGDINLFKLKSGYQTPSKFRSENHQWLPTEFQVDEKGHVMIKSYINNLHPEKHKKLYEIIPRILEKFIPLFEQVIKDHLEEKSNIIKEKK